MAKSHVHKRGSSNVEFNMTPMIDVTFQLIIFFILAGQIASAELAQLMLHKPWESQALKPEVLPKDKIVINVVSQADPTEKAENISAFQAAQAQEYRIGSKKIPVGHYDRLVETLKERKKLFAEGDEQPYVEIRSDYRINYAQVSPVMLAAAAAGFRKMNITALLELGSVE